VWKEHLSHRRQDEAIRRSRLLERPALGARLALGSALSGLRRPTAEIASYYADSLKPRSVLSLSQIGDQFVVSETDSPDIVFNVETQHGIYLVRKSLGGLPHPSDQFIASPPLPVSSMVLAPPERPSFLLWTTASSSTQAASLSSCPVGEQVSAFYVTMAYPDHDFWDLASSPSGNFVAVASNNGLLVYSPAEDRAEAVKNQAREILSVAFRDDNIVFTGGRGGTVRVVDLRARGGTVRLKHDGGGVGAMRCLNGGNSLLVRGLDKVRKGHDRSLPGFLLKSQVVDEAQTCD